MADGSDAALQLPWDFTRTPSTQHVAERYAFDLHVPTIGMDREALTIAAFAIALHRYSGQATILLDIRRRGSAHSLELAIANTTCRELVTRTEDGLNGELHPPRHAGATVAWDDADPLADLTLELGKSCALVYNATLFKPSTIERLAGHLDVLMKMLGSRIDDPIAKLPLVAPTETPWLEATGTTRTLHPPLAHQLVEHRASRSPASLARAAAEVREPETPMEQKLAAIWRAVLRVEQVGIDDNFFELGADSLLAMEMMTRAETELHVAIDGMDVLRESLEVLAGICDSKLGSVVAKAPRARIVGGNTETFFFDGLYGVLHGNRPATEAVLICPPIGQEAVRAHFILSRVGSLLAARGTPVMRFDYYGLGDSDGTSVEATPARWQRDIAAARDALVRKTGATRITGLGARFGATLLATAGIAASLVLWDPVARGEEWFDEQGELHRRYLRGQQDLRRGRRPHQPIGGEERLGVTYSPVARAEITKLALPRFEAPMRWLATHDITQQSARFDALSSTRIGFEALALDCGWRDLSRFEDLIPDVGIARVLVAMVTS